MIHLNKIKHISRYVILLSIILIGGIFITLNLYLDGLKVNNNPSATYKIIADAPRPEASPTPTATPVPTLVPSTPTPTQPALFPLHIVVVDYSKARVGDMITHLNVRLFSEKGDLIAEKKPSAYVREGSVGSGGDALFLVPFGTYRAECEGDGKKGTLTITIDSAQDDQTYTIYMIGSSIKISGRYFLDSNKNTQYDQGEKLFSNKEVSAVVDTEGKLYTAFKTKTDDNGYFEMYPSVFGKYTFSGEQVDNYKRPPEYWIELSGSRTVTRDIYLWE